MREEYKSCLLNLVEKDVLRGWADSSLRKKDQLKSSLTFWKKSKSNSVWLFIRFWVDDNADWFGCQTGWNEKQKIKSADFLDPRTLDFEKGSYELNSTCLGLGLLAEGSEKIWILTDVEELSDPKYYEKLYVPISEADVKTKVKPFYDQFYQMLVSVGIPYIEGR